MHQAATHLQARRRLVLVTVSTAALVLAMTGGMVARQNGSVGPDGCEPFTEGVSEDHPFVPFDARRTQVPPIPIVHVGSAADPAPEAPGQIDGLDPRWTVRTASGSIYRYYAESPLTPGLTPDEFWGRGGIELDIDPLTDAEPFWRLLAEEFPTLTNPVRVGPYDGVVVWADPAQNGIRTHNVYWSDGKSNFGLILDRPVSVAVTLAREVACSP